MTTELYWLVLSILLTSILWMPYIINRLLEHGIFIGLWDPDGKTNTEVFWAKRLMSAHANSVENLVVFAPLVIIAHIPGLSTELTEQAAILLVCGVFLMHDILLNPLLSSLPKVLKLSVAA